MTTTIAALTDYDLETLLAKAIREAQRDGGSSLWSPKGVVGDIISDADVALIVAVRNVLPELISEARALRERADTGDVAYVEMRDRADKAEARVEHLEAALHRVREETGQPDLLRIIDAALETKP